MRRLIRGTGFVVFLLFGHLALAAPTFTSAPADSVDAGATYTYAVVTADPEAGDRSISATALPGWLQLSNVDAGTGTATLQGTPAQEDVGTHTVSLLVTNTLTSATATQDFTITVAAVNAAPSFTSSPVTSATQGSAYSYSITTSDPDGGSRTVTAEGGLPGWLALSSVNSSAGTATLSGTPTAANVGSSSVTLRVTDAAGASATQPFTITVEAVNAAPAFTSAPVTSATQGSAYSYSITTSDPDAGDTRTVAAQGSLPAWLTLSSVSPSAGTATLSGTPTAANVGSSSVALRVTDAAGAAATQSFTITVEAVNAAPAFTSAPVTSATQGSAYSYSITTSDPDAGDTRTVAAQGSLPAWLTLSSVNPSAGTATLSGTPAAANVGSNPVTLRVTDSDGAAATQSFAIAVAAVPAAPSFTSAPVTSATQGSVYSYEIRTSDPNAGDTRIVGAQSALPTWLRLEAVDATNGTARLTGTPGPTDGGTHAIALVVTDNGGLSATQSFAITVALLNATPVFTSSPSGAVTQGQPYLYNITTADADAAQTRTIAATLLPSWLTLSALDPVAGSATLSGTPGPTVIGPQPVALRVADNGTPSAFATQSFTITVEAPPNVPPRAIAPIPPQTATENAAFQLLDANGAPTTLAAFFEDGNRDPLTYDVVGLPTGSFSVDRTTGALSGTPTTADARDTPYVVSVTASDGQSVSAPLTFTLTIALIDRADVAVTATATPQAVTIGATVEWRFAITNAGPQPSGASTVSAQFVGNPFTFVQLGSCVVTAAGDPQTLECAVPPVAAGGVANVVVLGSAAQAGDAVVNAEVRAAAAVPIDPNADNNRASAAVNVAEVLSSGPAQTLATKDNTGAAAGDVNGDGFIDLVLPKSTGRAAEVFLNGVSPTNAAQRRFSESPIAFNDPTPSSDGVLADLDKDGDLDFVTSNAAGASNNVFLNNGAGVFALWATLGAGNSAAVAAADFNGDDRVDLAFANNGVNETYLNGSNTTFTLSDSIDSGDHRDVVAADLDVDGRLDLLFANATGASRWARNLGGGQFAEGATIDNGGAQAVAVGDFDGDSRPDVVFARATSSAPAVVLYRNNPDGTFTYRSGVGVALVNDVVVGDIDLNGTADVVAISSTGTHQLYLGSGTGGLALHRVQFTSASALGAVLGKFGVDDRIDLAVAGTENATIFFNDGSGGLGAGDTQPPVIQVNGPTDVSLTVESTYQDQGATATDVLDGNLTSKIVTGNPVNTAVIGTYTVTYDVADSSGNAAARQTRTVRVTAREGVGGGGGGAVGTPFVLLGVLLWLVARVRRRALQK